jgi:hypothetical protein
VDVIGWRLEAGCNMCLKRGTTNTLVFDVGIDTKEISQLWLTFSHFENNDSEVFTKTIKDVILENTKINVNLSQEDTLSLNTHNMRETQDFIQLRALMKDGQALASNIVSVNVDKLLKDGVIS